MFFFMPHSRHLRAGDALLPQQASCYHPLLPPLCIITMYTCILGNDITLHLHGHNNCAHRSSSCKCSIGGHILPLQVPHQCSRTQQTQYL